ncbi:type II secretory pathway, component PulD [Opitutaceae bacterium TAV1]|nr:type II secretory pathway, component PulD [Opitutaceae bacterium TAV1]
MKSIRLPKSIIAALAVPALFAMTLPSNLSAQSQTETKIRLMADALSARDKGDLATAKSNLEQLRQLAPDDVTVQRLLASVNAAQAQGGPAISAAPADSTAAAPEGIAEISYPPRKDAGAGGGTGAASVPAAPPDPASQLAQAEESRIADLLKNTELQRKHARSLAKEKDYDGAIATLDETIQTLPDNTLTLDTIVALEKEKGTYALAKAQYLSSKGDTEGARAVLENYANSSLANEKRIKQLEARIAGRENNPENHPIEEINPKFVADQKVIQQLTIRGRAQYLNGDIDGAQETFRRVETMSAADPAAKYFLRRIADEKAAMGKANREKTTALAMQQVAESWQLPGIYRETVVQDAADARINPLRDKISKLTMPSVDLRNMPLSQVVQTLSALAEDAEVTQQPPLPKEPRINIVLLGATDKAPPVNLRLQGMTLKRVLDILVESIGYRYDVSDIVSIKSGGGGTDMLEMEVFPISKAAIIRMTGVGSGSSAPAAAADPFAAPAGGGGGGGSGGGEADGIRNFLQNAGVQFGPGSALAYDGAAIFVTQTTTNLERVRNILARFNDVRQVEIEAKFMDVQAGALDELGVQWGATKVSLSGHGATITSPTRSLSGAFGISQSSSSVTINGNSYPSGAPTLPGTVTDGSDTSDIANLSGWIGEFAVNASIRAIAQNQATELLSAPKVTVLSGNPALMVVAQELRYPQSFGEIESEVGTASSNGGGSAGVTITAGTPEEFVTRNIGVELRVTPTVEDDNYSITLDLNPKVTEFEGFVEYGGLSIAISGNNTVTVPSGFYQPIFSTREVTTKVTVWDGATLVMGGLTREEVKRVNDKVPVLGDIPYLGRLFRSKGETSQKRNLLVFVTANLVSPGGSPKRQTLQGVQPNAQFQNPTLVTPAGSEPRVRSR